MNVKHELRGATDWNNAEWDRLWIYNLHYFDDLNAEHSASRRGWHHDLILKWIAENPPATGAGWEPYPLSLRIVNWIKWAFAGHTLSGEALHSLAIQVRYLTKRLEFHLLGNHLLANAKALVFAGMFFEGEEAEAWANRGLAILAQQIPEQILSDGGHFERSPMYHSIVLEDILDLINLLQCRSRSTAEGDSQVQDWRVKAAAMLRWLRATTHQDEEIALFNDGALGIACPPAELFSYAERLSIGAPHWIPAVVHLPVSGYVRIASGKALAILDVGKIGPDYQPGHAHADTLSFELSITGHRVIVNSGTSCYGQGTERLRQRSTSAHNTVEINGESSSEVWGGFRVARRAYPIDLHMVENDGAVYVRCAHDGYRRLAGRPVHQREWSMRPDSMVITDHIIGSFGKAVARFHFHPGFTVTAFDDSTGTLFQNGVRLNWTLVGARGRIVNSTYHPEFGLTLPNECLEVELTGPLAKTRLEWTT